MQGAAGLCSSTCRLPWPPVCYGGPCLVQGHDILCQWLWEGLDPRYVPSQRSPPCRKGTGTHPQLDEVNVATSSVLSSFPGGPSPGWGAPTGRACLRLWAGSPQLPESLGRSSPAPP